MRRALVTGSSRGIGRAIALRLAEDGWEVALHHRGSPSGISEVAEQLGSKVAGVYRADLAQPGEAERLWQEAIRDGDLHAVVNNAGAYVPCRILEAEETDWLRVWDETMALNVRAPMILCRLAAQRFAASGCGRIVNVASRVGFRGEAGAAAYAASKAALINLTRSFAVELAPRGVLLFGIAPGWVDTAMARTGMRERLASILETIPLGRMATPEDCANVVRFLLSGEADYLSGQTIDINGASYFH